MGCPGNDTTLNITIPVVMVSKSGGEELNKSMTGGEKGRSSHLFLQFCSIHFSVIIWRLLYCSSRMKKLFEWHYAHLFYLIYIRKLTINYSIDSNCLHTLIHTYSDIELAYYHRKNVSKIPFTRQLKNTRSSIWHLLRN